MKSNEYEVIFPSDLHGCHAQDFSTPEFPRHITHSLPAAIPVRGNNIKEKMGNGKRQRFIKQEDKEETLGEK